MLWGLIIAVILSVSSLNAQSESLIPLPPGVTFKNASPQQLADAVTIAVKGDSAQVADVFQNAILGATQRGFPESDEVRYAVSAITCAVVASLPQESLKELLLGILESFPIFSNTIMQAVAVTNPIQNAPIVSQARMNLGNIRVLKVEGGSVELVDSSGSISNLKAGDFIRQGSKLVTSKKVSVFLIFENGSLVQVNPETEFYIDQFTQEPFNAEAFDYQKMENEPSSSQTKFSVPEGTIIMDVAKLKKGSSYEISTPLGIAGIRGTSLYVESKGANKDSPLVVGVATGQVQFTSTNGESRPVAKGEALGVSRSSSGFSFSPNPPGSAAMLQKTLQTASGIRQSLPASAFKGAPPSIPAPSSSGSNLTPLQQQVLAQASVLGNSALVMVSQGMAIQFPEAAAGIAAKTASLAPNAASRVAVTLSMAVPNQAANIATAVCLVVPSESASVAAAVALAMPAKALVLATVLSTALPSHAPAIAVSLAGALPAQAGAIAACIVTAVPAQQVAIVAAVSQSLPAQSNAIEAAVNSGMGDSVSSSKVNLPKSNAMSINPATMARPTPQSVSPHY